MIKLKKAASLTLLLSMLIAPIAAQADELDDKIKEQDRKIEAIQKTTNDAEAQLAEIEANVNKIEKEVYTVLQQKNKEEQKLTKLNAEIAELKIVIAKRDAQIENQARDVQTNSSATSFVDVMLESESIGEAMSKAMAMTTIVNANNDILVAQQEDQKTLEKLQAESEKRLAVIQEKTEELRQKQEELADARLTQEVKIQELNAELATEKDQKAKFQKQKEEAERKRQEHLRQLAEQRKREEAARAQAEKDAAARQAQQQAQQEQAQAEAAEQGTPVTELPEAEVEVESPATSSGWGAPLSTGLTVTSPFGWRANPTGSGSEHHDGIDFAGSSGTPVFATKGGKVVAAEFHWSAGNHVIIQHADGHYSYYMHLSSFAVSSGQTVSQGQQLGGMGTTGNSTGVHLHFGVSTSLWSGFVDPAPLLGI